MRFSISKSLVSGVAAVVMSLAAALSSAPADAAFFHGGGFGGFHGGGFGGFHPGGFGGWHGGWGHPGWGGWRGGGWGWRGGYWRGGYWGGGCGWGGCGWWPGLAAGALVGAAVTSPYWAYGYGYPYYGYGYPYATAGYGYGDSCWVQRPVYNRFGHYIGRRLINVC